MSNFPKSPGVYRWYCDEPGLEKLGIDKSKLVESNGKYLVYVGKDNQSIQRRMRWHMESNYPSNQKTVDPNKFMLSTLRHSLGSLLFESNQGIELDQFMSEHLSVEFVTTTSKKETEVVEDELIRSTPYLPLNLRGNPNRDEFHTFLSMRRKSFKRNTIEGLES